MVARNEKNRRKRKGREAYLQKARELGGMLPKGAIALIEVSHDDHCSIWRTGECNCSPEVRVNGVLR